MARIKDVAAIAEKWARVTPGRADEFSRGVQNPRTDWAAATAGASASYDAGVQEGIKRGAFKKGVSNAGTAKWQSNTLAKGPARFSEGVGLAQPTFQEAFAPYASVIESTQLPQRYARGDPRNMDRSKAIAMALNKRRVGSK